MPSRPTAVPMGPATQVAPFMRVPVNPFPLASAARTPPPSRNDQDPIGPDGLGGGGGGVSVANVKSPEVPRFPAASRDLTRAWQRVPGASPPSTTLWEESSVALSALVLP